MALTPLRSDPAHPFQLVKFLSWSSLIIILSSGLFLSVFIANYARRTVLENHHEFSLLLAENLNHQIYQRFTLPTILGFGRIQLKEEAQYNRLEKVIETTIHSFHVLEVRIYDSDSIIAFATKPELVNNAKLAGKAVKQAYEEGEHSFELLNRVGPWRALFAFQLEPESFVLKTTYPLRAERTLGTSRQGPIMGVLEFTQDITEDYETVIYFQWLIIVITIITSLILFLILFLFFRRADTILADRVKEKDRLEKELHQNEKLASMGRMVASIAHEIRNPLGIIRSSSELLYNRAKAENDPNARLLKATFDESKRLTRTLSDFLDYARPKPPRLDTIRLDEVLNRVTSFLEQEIRKKGAQLIGEYEENLLIRGDKDLLYRAFYNLVINALQAMDSNGSVFLKVREDKGKYIVTVEDTGPGFDLRLTDKYMEPFYTTKDQGTGLGLAIVSNIISSHGGSLTVSNSEQGGIVEVRLEKVKK